MKKLIALIVITALLFSGCSMFGQAEESSSLFNKLSGLERDAQRETDTVDETESLPDSFSFEQLDPYDMLHNGWTLTQEKALDEYGMEDMDGYTRIDLPQLLPYMNYGSATAFWHNGQVSEVTEYNYNYYFGSPESNEDAVQVFRLAVEAADEYFDGRNKSWGDEKFDNFESLDNLEFVGLLIHDGDDDPYASTSCNWGFYVDGNPGIFTIILRAYDGRMDELLIEIDFRSGRTLSKKYFPDDAAENTASESAPPSEPSESESSAAEENPSALYTEPPGSATAVDMVRLGTYENDDVFGVGLVWRVTFYNDYTFDFSYDHEEGTEYYTGNWHTEDNGGELKAILNITNAAPFTISLDVDGGKYVYVDDFEFWPDVVVLPFVG